jgi:hypothetical protein
MLVGLDISDDFDISMLKFEESIDSVLLWMKKTFIEPASEIS